MWLGICSKLDCYISTERGIVIVFRIDICGSEWRPHLRLDLYQTWYDRWLWDGDSGRHGPVITAVLAG